MYAEFPSLRPKKGPLPPEDVVQLQQQIAGAGKAPSATAPAAAGPVHWRIVAKLGRHPDRLHHAAFSPDARWVVTSCGDKLVRVWEVATGRVAAEMRGHTGPVFRAAFSPDGRLVVTASQDGRARVWQAATGKAVAELKVHAKVFGTGWQTVISAAFSPDGSRVATFSSDGKARLWDAEAGALEAELKGEDAFAVRAAFSPGGAPLITYDAQGTGRVSGTQTAALLAALGDRAKSLRDLSFGAGATRAATEHEGGSAGVWEVATGALLLNLEGTESFPVTPVAIHPLGKWVVAGKLPPGKSQAVRVIDVATGKVVAGLRGPDTYVQSVAFSADGKWAVTAGADGWARVWEVPGT